MYAYGLASHLSKGCRRSSSSFLFAGLSVFLLAPSGLHFVDNWVDSFCVLMMVDLNAPTKVIPRCQLAVCVILPGGEGEYVYPRDAPHAKGNYHRKFFFFLLQSFVCPRPEVCILWYIHRYVLTNASPDKVLRVGEGSAYIPSVLMNLLENLGKPSSSPTHISRSLCCCGSRSLDFLSK